MLFMKTLTHIFTKYIKKKTYMCGFTQCLHNTYTVYYVNDTRTSCDKFNFLNVPIIKKNIKIKNMIDEIV